MMLMIIFKGNKFHVIQNEGGLQTLSIKTMQGTEAFLRVLRDVTLQPSLWAWFNTEKTYPEVRLQIFDKTSLVTVMPDGGTPVATTCDSIAKGLQTFAAHCKPLSSSDELLSDTSEPNNVEILMQFMHAVDHKHERCDFHRQGDELKSFNTPVDAFIASRRSNNFPEDAQCTLRTTKREEVICVPAGTFKIILTLYRNTDWDFYLAAIEYTTYRKQKYLLFYPSMKEASDIFNNVVQMLCGR